MARATNEQGGRGWREGIKQRLELGARLLRLICLLRRRHPCDVDRDQGVAPIGAVRSATREDEEDAAAGEVGRAVSRRLSMMS